MGQSLPGLSTALQMQLRYVCIAEFITTSILYKDHSFFIGLPSPVVQRLDLQVLIATSSSEYLCVKPAPGYKKLFAHTAEQAEILYEVQLFPTPACQIAEADQCSARDSASHGTSPV